MYCSQCGTELTVDSIFCFKCGKPIPVQSQIAAPSPVDSALPQPRPLEPAPQPPKPAGLTRRQIFTLVFWALLLFFSYASVFIAALYGENYDVAKNGVGLMLITGYSFWYFWKVRNHKGWVGGVVGVAVSILSLFLGAAIGGYVRGQPDYILEHTPPFATIKERFPKEYESILQGLIAAGKAKGKNLTTEEVMGLIGQKTMFLLNQSLKTTSNPAMLLFAKAKLSSFRDVAKGNPSDCYTMMSGTIADADPATQIRISKSMSPETDALNGQAMQNVVEDSDTYRQAMDSPTSEAHFKALLAQLDTVLTNKYSLSVYYFTDNSLNMPADVRCKAGIAMFEEAMNLPSDDRAFMLRKFFAP
jgi:hypothetical protein